MEGATFTVDDVLKLLGAGAAIIAGYYFLKTQFEQNAASIEKLDRSVSAIDKKIDRKFETVNTELQKQGKMIVKVEAHGTILEERIQAMAGPRA